MYIIFLCTNSAPYLNTLWIIWTIILMSILILDIQLLYYFVFRQHYKK